MDGDLGDLGDLRVVIAHEWVTADGGSEKVVQALLDLFPTARVVSAAVDPVTAARLFPGREVERLWTDRLPGVHRRWQYYGPLFVGAWAAHRVRDADLLVTSSHFATPAAALRFRGPHLSYVHTPLRMAWRPDIERMRLPGPLAPVGALAAPGLRAWDRWVSRVAGELVANSSAVQDRIRRAYGREAAVVHPPVEVGSFLTVERRPAAEREAFLVFGRLVGYKRADLAVAACTRLGLPLVVAGSGPEEARLRAMAGPTVTFLGRVDDATYRDLLGSARALLFPGEEDFGLVPVEAQAAGCPVIAFGAGGALDTVDPALGNVLFDAQTVDCLIGALTSFVATADRDGSEDACEDAVEQARRASTARFAPEVFRSATVEAVRRALARDRSRR